MKKLSLFICSLVLLAGYLPAGAGIPGENTSEAGVQVLCSSDLHKVVSECIEGIEKAHPGSDISVMIWQGEDLQNWIADPNHLAILSKNDLEGIDSRTVKLDVLGREVFVPIMNSGNPYKEDILRMGISPNDFATIYSASSSLSWGSILQNSSNLPLHAYRTSEASFTQYLDDFLGTHKGITGGAVKKDCEEVMHAVQDDRNAIGFCSLNQMMQVSYAGGMSYLALIPVDLNDNNKIDHFEAIYGSLDDLSRGIWIGKYTEALYSRIFALTSSGQVSEEVRSVIRWMAEDGQLILAANGYSTLMDHEKEVLLAKLDGLPVVSSPEELLPKQSNAFVLVLAIILVSGALFLLIYLTLNNKQIPVEEIESTIPKAFLDTSSEVPKGYYFDRSHTWTYLERDGFIRIGIDNFMQKITGTITKVDMKNPGDQIKRGQTLFTLMQNGKRLEIKSPVSGIIRERNEDLLKRASLINSSPFGEGWVCLLEPINWIEEMQVFLVGHKYREWILFEYTRLKDFLTRQILPKTLNAVVLQEGGEVCEGVLGELGPKDWEDFQSGYLRN